MNLEEVASMARKAYFSGLTLIDNPFSMGMDEYYEWESTWLDCRILDDRPSQKKHLELT